MSKAGKILIGAIIAIGGISLFSSAGNNSQNVHSSVAPTAEIVNTSNVEVPSVDSPDNAHIDAIASSTPSTTSKPVLTATPSIIESTATPATQTSSSGGSYVNSDGNKIQSPTYSDTVPVGATAQCRDGTYSFSQHRSGTCSHHGGVAEWL